MIVSKPTHLRGLNIKNSPALAPILASKKTRGDLKRRAVLLLIGTQARDFINDPRLALFESKLIMTRRGGGKWESFGERVVSELDRLRRQGMESRQIFLVGFAAGASIALTVSLTYPHPLGGVVAADGEVRLSDGWKKDLTAGAFYTPRLVLRPTVPSAPQVSGHHEGLDALRSVGVHVRSSGEAGLDCIVEWLIDHQPKGERALRRLVRERLIQISSSKS